MTPQEPEYTSETGRRLRSMGLIGVPYIVLSLNDAHEHRVIAELQDGTKIRAFEVEKVFNDALLIDSIEGPGAYRRQFGKPENAILTQAEHSFGVDLLTAVPMWQTMQRTNLELPWERRQRALWPGKAVVI